ncbi:Gfo/Idh/MocA family protein [Halostella litorea]|uniref:Gfo/Idh/MocA family protein n=1 Tax=Halostella litorea TaxID=2528831 RepID=UPI0010920864|nr:Gfo/Idh/MocA family oxidoreductase [Halostella litorea]
MNFGVLSTAHIARTAFIPALDGTDHDVVAIASRDGDRAAAAAEDHGIPRSYGSYEALLEDDGLDAVYNPLPNAHHAEWTERAADAGLHVLCEKPLGVDADEARELGEYCDERGVTLMEAFMYRYNPRTERAIEVVEEELGEVRSVQSRFSFRMGDTPDDIRLSPDLAGGSLMDVGCYAIHATRQFLGEPERVVGTTNDARGAGVETEAAATLEYEGGATAQVSSGFETPETQYYRVETTDGWLEVTDAFNTSDVTEPTLTYAVDGRTVTETFEPVDQYALEADHFADCVAEGRTPLTDAEDAAATLAVIDAIKESAATDAPATLD